jgi:hypothetical protein
VIQCKDCEFCEMAPDGQAQLKCNPFTNVREPECLVKWQLLRLDLMTRAYMMTVAEYRKLAPLQDKLYRRMSREIDEMDDNDSWKRGPDDDPPEDEGDGPGLPPLDDRL